MSATKKWENYEQVAGQLLRDIKDRLSLSRIEPKQKRTGDATDWEVDVVAYEAHTEKLILVECKLLSYRVDQRTMGSFAYSIKDSGAKGGIFVTTIGFQTGARKIANKEKIAQIILRGDSDVDNYVAELMNHIVIKITVDSFKAQPELKVLSPPKSIEVTLSGFSTEVEIRDHDDVGRIDSI